jgi:CRISPR/Cas system CSM-associated protein Csm5 (group 7 of RAMP superfamily)
MNLAALKDTIEELPKHHHIEIARIVLKNETAYNENQNGIFVNMSALTPETIAEMKKYLEHVALQESQLKEDEEWKGELKETYFSCTQSQTREQTNNRCR